MSETLDLSRLEATLPLGNQASQVPGIPETGVLSRERGTDPEIAGREGPEAPLSIIFSSPFKGICMKCQSGDFYLSISNLLFKSISSSHPALEVPAKGLAAPAWPALEEPGFALRSWSAWLCCRAACLRPFLGHIAPMPSFPSGSAFGPHGRPLKPPLPA